MSETLYLRTFDLRGHSVSYLLAVIPTINNLTYVLSSAKFDFPFLVFEGDKAVESA